MKKPVFSIILAMTVLAVVSCSPNPASGVWQATDSNNLDISKMVIAFDGRADLYSEQGGGTIWRCFWAAKSTQETVMDCTPSTDPDHKVSFVVTVNDNGMAELVQDSKSLGSFRRLNENPKIKE